MTVDERSPLLVHKDAPPAPDHGDHDVEEQNARSLHTLSVVIALVGG